MFNCNVCSYKTAGCVISKDCPECNVMRIEQCPKCGTWLGNFNNGCHHSLEYVNKVGQAKLGGVTNGR